MKTLSPGLCLVQSCVLVQGKSSKVIDVVHSSGETILGSNVLTITTLLGIKDFDDKQVHFKTLVLL